MQMIISIALGGAVGAVARHFLSARIMSLLGSNFPYGTLVVNVLGSFIMGLLIMALATRLNISQEWRGFIVVGVLGGFTTFSTFSLEAALLIERGTFLQAALYVGSSVIVSIGALFVGLWLGRIMA